MRLHKKLQDGKKILLIKRDSVLKLRFLRYIASFIIGIRGPKCIALRIKKRFFFLLKFRLQLKINEDQVKLIHIFNEKLCFLGMIFKGIKKRNVTFRRISSVEQCQRIQLHVLSTVRKYTDRSFKYFRAHILGQLRKKYKEFKYNYTSKNSVLFLEKINTIFSILNVNKNQVKQGQRFLLNSIIRELSLLQIKELEQNVFKEKFKELQDLVKSEKKKIALISFQEFSSLLPITKVMIIQRIVQLYGKILGLRMLSYVSIKRLAFIIIFKYYPYVWDFPKSLIARVCAINKSQQVMKFRLIFEYLRSFQIPERIVYRRSCIGSVFFKRFRYIQEFVDLGLVLNADLFYIKQKLEYFGILKQNKPQVV